MRKMNCDRCSRGCAVEITEENGKTFVSGNNCAGGEQSARERWPELKERQILPKVEEKRSFLSRLFSRS